jgi:hypothetical protein
MLVVLNWRTFFLLRIWRRNYSSFSLNCGGTRIRQMPKRMDGWKSSSRSVLGVNSFPTENSRRIDISVRLLVSALEWRRPSPSWVPSFPPPPIAGSHSAAAPAAAAVVAVFVGVVAVDDPVVA